MEQRRFGFLEENLLSPADAIAAFFERVTLAAPASEFVTLDDAHGRILAERIDADRDYPDAPRSAMDGFALASSAVPGRLSVVGEIAMGGVWPGTLRAGEAVHIPTGGVVPEGADAVVPIEDAVLDGSTVVVTEPFAPGDNVNPRAFDMRQGEAVLHPGGRIAGPQLGVLATLGITRVPVFRRPVVGIVSSGDELIDPGSVPRPGQIRDSNRYAIAGTLRAMGAEPLQFPTASDDPGALEAALRFALGRCDALVITGGSSVGERDRTPDAVTALGRPGVIVHGLRVKPGKPTVLAAVEGKPIVGLPGNPTSALMILEAVAAPVFEALTGISPGGADTVDAVLGSAARSRRGWTWYVPVTLRHEGASLVAHPLPLRSSMVSLTARAGGYLEIGPGEDEIPAGSSVRIRRFR